MYRNSIQCYKHLFVYKFIWSICPLVFVIYMCESSVNFNISLLWKWPALCEEIKTCIHLIANMYNQQARNDFNLEFQLIQVHMNWVQF